MLSRSKTRLNRGITAAQTARVSPSAFPLGSESGALTRNTIITELTRSPHGQLADYQPVATRAAQSEPEFLAHLIAWDRVNGQIRDSKVAMPVISLATRTFPEAFTENSLAHIASLSPRDLVRALRFAKTIKTDGRMRSIRRVVGRYLKIRESNIGWFDRTVLQHRASIKELYGLSHVKPNSRAQKVLFDRDYPAGSVFADVKALRTMSPKEAAGTILNRKIPFLVVQGALGAKDPDLVLAMLGQMTPAEITNNMKMLQKLGVGDNPVLKAAMDEALEKIANRTAKSKSPLSALKLSKAAEAVGDGVLKKKIQAAQETVLGNSKGIDGNWVVLGDKSGSMQAAIETSRHVAATLAKMVRGKVHLIFFDTAPRYIDATGKTYDELAELTRYVTANGGTSIGAGLMAAIEKGAEIDGIAIVSDAAENSAPAFAHVYGALTKQTGKMIPVYLYRVAGRSGYSDIDLSRSMAVSGHDLQEFDLRGGVDYYSIPNLVATMRASRYSLADEILSTPLLTLNEVFHGAESC